MPTATAIVPWLSIVVSAVVVATTVHLYVTQNDHDAKVRQHEDQLTVSDAKLEASQRALSAQVQKINNDSLKLGYHSTTLDDHETRLSSAESTLSTHDTSITNLFTLTDTHETKLSADESTLSTHSSRLTAVENAIVDLGGNLSSDSHHLVIDNLSLVTSVVASSTYTFPNVGATADVVMTEGAQSINGVKTFSNTPVFSASIQITSNAGSGKVLQSDAQGNASWGVAGGGSGNYGDGSDGTVTATNGMMLTRDMYYDTLHIPANCILYTKGYRIFCKTALTFVDSTSIIDNSGSNGGGQTYTGTGITTGPGAGGSGAASGTLGGGGNGGGGDSVPSGAGSPGATSTNVIDAASFRGGSGKITGGGQTAAQAVTGNPAADGGNMLLHQVGIATSCRNLSGTRLTGGGGGSGSGGEYSPLWTTNFYGAGGGGGAGVIMIAAASITHSGGTKGVVRAKGGNGGVSTTFNGQETSYGAGGGGGGLITIVSDDITAAQLAIDVDVSGGLAGQTTASNGVVNNINTGTDGQNGLAYFIQV